jgi:aminoglycoside phosphotransferase (APT) family kinase protein
MYPAARWIGEFHRTGGRLVGSPSAAFMDTYDAEYYLGWAFRTPLLARALAPPPRWLEPLCDRAEELLAPLLSAPRTLIHGEYYPQNILFREGTVHPVDWESAAVAAGEIDLAALTEQWHPEIVRQCEAEYRRARWPGGAPAGWERVLAAARLYLHFRWLGDSPVATAHPEARWRFEALRAAGEQAGVI